MGCQLDSGTFSINTTRVSTMAIKMCSKWYVPQRDNDSDGRDQTQIHESAIQEANNEWPLRTKDIYTKFLLEHFDFYKSERSIAGNLDIFENDFKNDLVEARTFIAEVADFKESVSISR